MTAHKIVIVGGGAGGLELATQLGQSLGRNGKAQITLIDQKLTSIRMKKKPIILPMPQQVIMNLFWARLKILTVKPNRFWLKPNTFLKKSNLPRIEILTMTPWCLL